MIVNIDEADTPPRDQHYDVCIAGGGIAGISLAKALVSRGRRVLLMEAGGLEYSDRSQAVYAGQSIGRGYFDLDDCRSRFLGGSSNCWGGWSRPMDSYDFDPRPHISETGWPIRLSDLQPYLAPAREILELGELFRDRILPESNGYLKEIDILKRPVHFKDKYLDWMRSSSRLDVYLDANLVDIKFDPDTGRAAKFMFRGYRDKALVYGIAADDFVLALGGLENARFLMNLAERSSSGLPKNALLGRFFMEHLHNTIGYYVVDPTKTSFGESQDFLAPTEHMIRTEQIGNCGIRLENIPSPGDQSLADRAKVSVERLLCASEIVSDLLKAVGDFRCQSPPWAGSLKVASEQAPNPNSRMTLSNDVDEFGLRRIVLDWKLSPVDKTTMRRVGIALGEYFARADIGRVKLFDWVLSKSDTIPGLADSEETGGNHHMGTTRMGFSRDDGVVDRDCRLFGVANLYIAGSSVFRTAGHANPTLTLVQLALRLADHLAAA